LPLLFAEAEQAVANPLVFARDLQKSSVGLREWIGSIIESVPTAASQAILSRVLVYEEAQNKCDRAFVAGTNFDVAPQTLLTIEQSLAQQV